MEKRGKVRETIFGACGCPDTKRFPELDVSLHITASMNCNKYLGLIYGKPSVRVV